MRNWGRWPIESPSEIIATALLYIKDVFIDRSIKETLLLGISVQVQADNLKTDLRNSTEAWKVVVNVAVVSDETEQPDFVSDKSINRAGESFYIIILATTRALLLPKGSTQQK